MNKSISREERQRMVDEAARAHFEQLVQAGEDDVAAGRTVVADDAFWSGLKDRVKKRLAK